VFLRPLFTFHCLQDASIVDLGGGTGNFTQALAEASRARRRVLCVDAFAEMLQKASRARCR
jgi:ubiquinone/menaquinone biosynthesis C-methylase UbiE